MTRAEYRHRRAIWSAANDDRAGDEVRPPGPFRLWLAGWSAYLGRRL